MVSTSSTFKEKIIDGQTRQNFLITFDGGYLSANDGDFTDDGVTINEYMFTGDEIAFGECPSNTISFSVQNSTNNMYDFVWGKGKAYIGVLLSTESYTMSGNCYVKVGSYTYTGNSTGLYINGTLSKSGEIVSLVSDGNTTYAYGNGKAYSIVGTTVTSITYSNRMKDKLMTPHSILFSGNKATVWKSGTKETWEYCTVGQYNMSRPTRSRDTVVSIGEAYDDMEKLEADCSAFLSSLTYPTTCTGMVNSILTKLGISSESFTLYNGTTEITSTTFSTSNVSTYRDILYYILVLAESCARIDRNGKFNVQFLSTSTYSFSADHISMDFFVGDYTCAAPKLLTVGNTSGFVSTTGTGTNSYYVYGNPLISEPSAHMLSTVSAFPEYSPVEMTAIEADPSIECGDSLHAEADPVYLIDGGSNNIIDNEDDYIILLATAPFPVMTQTITWNNLTSTYYVASGYETRQIPYEASQYAVVVASGTAEEAKTTAESAAETASSAESTANTANTKATAAKTATDGLATGTTTVNGGCITTGMIKSGNSAYSLNLDTGEVNMASANITGGKIAIVSDSETNDKISLTYSQWANNTSPLQNELKNSSTGRKLVEQAGGIFLSNGGTTRASLTDSEDDSRLYLYSEDGTVSQLSATNGLYCHASTATSVTINPTVAGENSGCTLTVPLSGTYYCHSNFTSGGKYNLNLVRNTLYADSAAIAMNTLNSGGASVWYENSNIPTYYFGYLKKGTVLTTSFYASSASAVVNGSLTITRLG